MFHEVNKKPRAIQSTLPRVISLVLQSFSLRAMRALCLKIVRDICNLLVYIFLSLLFCFVLFWKPRALVFYDFFLPSAWLAATGCFLRVDATTSPMMARSVSLASTNIPVHAHCHTAMLTLPSGARGNEANHST